MYKQLYKPNHHRADITGMVPVHILVAEEAIHRPLKKGELVHHKDFNKLNNDIFNLLFPLTRPEHQKLPEYQARYLIAIDKYDEFLAWWIQERLHDIENSEIVAKEKELVRAQNERERLKKRASS